MDTLLRTAYIVRGIVKMNEDIVNNRKVDMRYITYLSDYVSDDDVKMFMMNINIRINDYLKKDPMSDDDKLTISILSLALLSFFIYSDIAVAKKIYHQIIKAVDNLDYDKMYIMSDDICSDMQNIITEMKQYCSTLSTLYPVL